ncbi:DUF805 domain-containing protein [Zunongwangia endophytica]|uniref:DUF805 domain-containing protein n=1 Tax=Zunongwangia endophytica TaxID=1808945 RepID=A0ABV8HCM5_9FLAO|nr:DUF805 domain-containing protein [Zunongwangia endophytica]MDN3593498.1 DUF805 domain-containing protein [Zunongwangia endophytica]
MKWYLKVFRQYSDFKGRARRKEYFMFGLINAIFSICCMLLSFCLSNWLETPAFIGIYVLYMLASLLPSLAVSVRRLHDIGKSGWMLLVGFIPLVGSIWMLILLITDSEPSDNQYGPNPKEDVVLEHI